LKKQLHEVNADTELRICEPQNNQNVKSSSKLSTKRHHYQQINYYYSPPATTALSSQFPLESTQNSMIYALIIFLHTLASLTGNSTVKISKKVKLT